MTDYIKPIAISFTNDEDKLTEQQEIFNLGMQTCKKKMQEKIRINQCIALKRFALEIDENHDLSNLKSKVYARRYVVSVKNLVAIMDDEIICLNRKIVDLEENNDLAEKQTELYINELDELEKARDDLAKKFYNLEKSYTILFNLCKKEEDDKLAIVSNNKNVRHLIILFYAIILYVTIRGALSIL